NVEEQEVRLDRSGRDENLFRSGLAICRREKRPQLETAAGLAVSKAEIEKAREQPFALFRGLEVQKLAHRQREDSALGNVVGSLGLPSRHPSLEREGLDLHGGKIHPKPSLPLPARGSARGLPSADFSAGRSRRPRISRSERPAGRGEGRPTAM